MTTLRYMEKFGASLVNLEFPNEMRSAAETITDIEKKIIAMTTLAEYWQQKYCGF
jgi:hypothetical protein